jgi:NADH dehydrogenase [ubiquinone] 1 alpha subcomplex assembly factor 1
MSKAELLSALERKGIQLNRIALDLFAHAGFRTSPECSTLEITHISVAELGYEHGAMLGQIFERAANHGLELCPLELAAHLRIAFTNMSSVDNEVMPRELFRFDTASSVADFSAIDDRVMGGRSASRLRHDPAGHAVFEGEVSLADGGGFASVRSRSLPLGDAQAVTCRIEVLGDGKRYKLSLRTDDLFDGVTYQATFEPAPGEWTVLRLPLASFKPTWRGRPVEVGPQFAGEPAPAGPRDRRSSGRDVCAGSALHRAGMIRDCLRATQRLPCRCAVPAAPR